MADKCFCHLNGYEVKDKKARDTLIAHEEVLQGLAEGQTDNVTRMGGIESSIDNQYDAMQIMLERIVALEQGTGSSGGGKLYRHTIKFHNNTDANRILTMEFLSSQGTEYCERRIGEIGNLFPNSPIKLENTPDADESFGTLSIKLVPNDTDSIYIQGPYIYDYSYSRYYVQFNYSNTVIDSYEISEV